MPEEYSELSEHIFRVNNVKNKRQFVNELRLYLRYDLGMDTQIARSLEPDEVVETWYKWHQKPENRIGGAEDNPSSE